ncbi:hypothetical protein BN946_scf184915.g33 [Trametes cinnabarina]|uniref:DUF427 domain-containing protein n=1 Tax=Pycnoporus cinnabarinus TaxID=5643 RepID=A0A060SHH5_PYCCI|nr:hypothetical protein BN946_scf184915.g33 [Trametes cinnabarina]
MVKVTLNGTVLAESDNTKVVEGNHYFPPDSVNTDVLSPSSTHECPTVEDSHGATSLTSISARPARGRVASYYDATIGGKTVVNDVAWYYPEPKEKASDIKGYLAFYKVQLPQPSTFAQEANASMSSQNKVNFE